VNQATEGRQIPWESSSLTSDFKFFSTNNGQETFAAAQASIPQPKAPDASASEPKRIQIWRNILQGKDPKVAYELVMSTTQLRPMRPLSTCSRPHHMGPGYGCCWSGGAR
jgi:hypothetical protein